MRRKTRRRRGLRASLRAGLLIAIVVIGQFALLDHLIASDRDAAHVLDVAGLQRMRTQRVAFLAEAIREEGPSSSRLAELRRTAAEMARTRRELLARPENAEAGALVLGPHGTGVRVGAFLTAAATYAAHPGDVTAYRTIMAERLPLLALTDAAVKWRSHRSMVVYDQLAGALAVSLVFVLATLVVAWRRIVLPNERTLERTLAQVSRTADHRSSLIDENPNSVAFFDRDAVIEHGNVSSLKMLGHDESLIGRHLSEIVARRAYPLALDAFRAALTGVPRTYETVLIAADGGEVDVEATVFPNVVNGSIEGVISVAKDISDVKLLQRQMHEQSLRVSELYRIASANGRSYEDQLDEALRLVAVRLGFEWASLVEVSDHTVTPVAMIGRPSGLERGRPIRLDRSLSRFAIESGEIWSVEDLRASSVAASIVPERIGFRSSSGGAMEVEHHAAGWGSVAIAPVRTSSGRLYGTLVVGSARTRPESLPEFDVEFLRTVSGLLGLVVERREQERRLDSLAFYDSLTGLANRVSLMDRLRTMSEYASRHDKEYAVLYLDLDKFKGVNDTFGHLVGDEVLRLAARRMLTCVRTEDTVARIGGDEFVILVPTPYGRAGAEDLAERILAAIKKPFTISGTTHLIGVSIGIALYPANGAEGLALLKAADAALYEAKRAGRNRMAFAA